MNTYNKISIFAEDAIVTNEEEIGTSQGYVYDDTTWRGTGAGFNPRIKGAYQGFAKSIEYNTAIRQSTLMSAVFADILAIRNSKSSDNGYSNMSTNGIGTNWNGEGSITDHIGNLSNIFAKGKFLFDNEVITSKINDKAVTTSKINDYAITSTQLGDILGTKTSSSNGMTVTLSQNNDKGSISISLSGNTVNNADALYTETSNSKCYLTGSINPTGYNDSKTSTSVYMQAGTLYASNLEITNTITANMFYARSDRRIKYDIDDIDDHTIIDFVENANVYMYKYKDNSKQSIGVIAQELTDYCIANRYGDSIYSIVAKGEDGILKIEENKLVYILLRYVNILNDKIKLLQKE